MKLKVERKIDREDLNKSLTEYVHDGYSYEGACYIREALIQAGHPDEADQVDDLMDEVEKSISALRDFLNNIEVAE